MRIGVPKERLANETRVAATPKTVEQLLKLGLPSQLKAARASWQVSMTRRLLRQALRLWTAPKSGSRLLFSR